MATNLETLLREAERRAVVAVLRDHPQWTLGHVFRHIDQNGPHALLLQDLTVGELLQEPGLDPIGRPSDGGPPIDGKRRADAQRLTGELFDEHVRAVLDEAGPLPVGAAYLRARVGGPRWKLQASLRRLLEAGLGVRGAIQRGSSRRDFRRGREAETKLYRDTASFRRQSPRRKDQARWRDGLHHGLLVERSGTTSTTRYRAREGRQP